MQRRAKVAVMARQEMADDALYRFAGLTIISLFPALFWTALIAGVGGATGYSLAPHGLAIVGTAIAAFCAAVGYALLTRTDA